MDNWNQIVSSRKSDAPSVAGHDLLELTYQIDAPPDRIRIIMRRNYRRFDDSAFSLSFGTGYLPVLGRFSPSHDVEIFVEFLQTFVLSAIDDQAPLQRFRVCKPSSMAH